MGNVLLKGVCSHCENNALWKRINLHIVCIHTECELTVTLIECAFSRFTSIGSLKANRIIT